MARRWVLALAAVTGLVYGALVALVLGPLRAEAGGALWFDLRWQGYDAAEAATYQGALGPAGLALAEGPVRGLDSLFIGLFTLLLLIGAARGWSGWPLLMPFTYGLADLGENAAVGAILRGGGPDVVARASLLTQVKFVLVVAAVAVAVTGLVRGRRG